MVKYLTILPVFGVLNSLEFNIPAQNGLDFIDFSILNIPHTDTTCDNGAGQAQKQNCENQVIESTHFA